MGIFKWDKKISLVGREKQKKKPKKVAKTAEEAALERRQRSALDDKIKESEERFAALARGKLVRGSLLSGAPRNAQEASSGRRSSGGGSGVGSMLGGRGAEGGSRASSGRSILSLANRSAK